MDNGSVRDEIGQYLISSRLAETTRQLYGLYLKLWTGYISEHRITQSKAKPLDLAEWLGVHSEWSISTRHSACCAVRAFYIWRYGRLHPILSYNVRREDSGPQRTPDGKKLLQLLASLDTFTANGRRSLAMITLMLDTGLRASEVCRLDLDHLELERGLLWVLRKGGKWKPARFFDYARSCLAGWLSIRPQFARPEVKMVFVVIIGGVNQGRPLNRTALRLLFNRMGERAGIGRLSPHDLRRAFATQSIDNGASSRLVQAQGGWADLQQLERYTQALDLERMRDFSPVDRLMGLPVRKARD